MSLAPEVPCHVVEWVLARDDFLIVSHLDSDGDSLGSSLALALALEEIGKRVTVAIAQDLPPRMAWLPAVERVRSLASAPDESRAAILVECSDFSRSGVRGLERLESLNIDHHTKNAMYADVNWIDPAVAATGMMIRQLLAAFAVELTPAMATLLYVTVLTDTGSFRHSNTDAEALQFAADMVRAGAEPEPISEFVYGNVEASRVQLMADALATLTLLEGGQVAWMVLTSETFERRGTRDTEGLINIAQEIAGVSVSLLFKEVEAGAYRVSLRSDGKVDVAELAASFGGGGHPRASGCELAGDFDAVRGRMLGVIQRALTGADAGPA